MSKMLEKYNKIMSKYHDGDFGRDFLTLAEILEKAGEPNLLREMSINDLEEIIGKHTGQIRSMLCDIRAEKLKKEDEKKMYKVVYIVSPNTYAESMINALNEENFKCTKMSTTGAFLNSGQTTIFTITESENVERIYNAIREVKKNKPLPNNVPNIFVFTQNVCDAFAI